MAEILCSGALFTSLEELKRTIFEYGKSHHTLFVQADSKKVKCSFEGHENSLDQYEYVTFVCKQGGKARSSRSKGIRPNQRSFKCGCPVKVRAVGKVNMGGPMGYRITKTCFNHNHPTSPEVFHAYPENRRIELTKALETLIRCSTLSNKELRRHVEDQQNITLLSSDIRNLKAKVKEKYLAEDLQEMDYPLENEAVIIPQKNSLTPQERFLEADKLIFQFSSYMASLDTQDFYHKFHQLESILTYWKNNRSVAIFEAHDESNNETHVAESTVFGSVEEIFEVPDRLSKIDSEVKNILSAVSRPLIAPITAKCGEGVQCVVSIGNEGDHVVGENIKVGEVGGKLEPADSKVSIVIESAVEDGGGIEYNNNADTGISNNTPPLPTVVGTSNTKSKGKVARKSMGRKRKAKTPEVFLASDTITKMNILISGIVLDSALEKSSFEVDDIKTVSGISSVAIDGAISVYSIKDRFTDEAFECLLARLKEKARGNIHVCPVCDVIHNGKQMMAQCDHCLQYFHYQCVGLRTSFRAKIWFCDDCLCAD